MTPFWQPNIEQNAERTDALNWLNNRAKNPDADGNAIHGIFTGLAISAIMGVILWYVGLSALGIKP